MKKRTSKFEIYRKRMYNGFYGFMLIFLACLFSLVAILETEDLGGEVSIPALIVVGIVALADIVIATIYFYIYIKLFG